MSKRLKKSTIRVKVFVKPNAIVSAYTVIKACEYFLILCKTNTELWTVA